MPSEVEPIRGVQHFKTTDELLAFARVDPLEKLRWLASVHALMSLLPHETQELMQRFRREEL